MLCHVSDEIQSPGFKLGAALGETFERGSSPVETMLIYRIDKIQRGLDRESDGIENEVERRYGWGGTVEGACTNVAQQISESDTHCQSVGRPSHPA